MEWRVFYPPFDRSSSIILTITEGMVPHYIKGTGSGA